METNSKTMLAAGGILAVALTIGSQIDGTKKPVMEPVSVEVSKAVKGAEIKSMRTVNAETFKADSAWVHPKDAKGAIVKADSFKVAAFTAKVYARPKYFKDADGDTLRPLDLTVRDISALAKLNPLKTHDKYVDAGPYDARWMDDKPGDFRMDSGGAYVKYRALFKGAAVTVQATADGMKELVTLADSTAPKTLRWVVETDGSLVANAAGGFDVRAKDGSIPMRIQRPVVWDAESRPVMASATVEGDTLTFRVTVLPGQKYPVTVDPTTTVTVGSEMAGYTYSDKSGSYVSSVYADAKDETVGSASYTYYGLNVGQYASGGEGCTSPGCPRVMIYRSFIALPGAIAGMATVSACTLFVDGGNDYTATDFDIKMYGARSWKSTLTTADFSRFHGWGTTNLTGTNLIETWNTSSYSSGLNALVLNAAGRDSLLAASGDTLWVALASSRDASYQTPTLNTLEHIEFTGPGGSGPYWSYTYTLAYSQTPTGYTLHTPTASGVKASWTNRHSTAVDSLSRFTGAGAWAKTLAKTDTSETITGLTPNTQYIYKARVDSGGTFGYSNADTLYTLANPPATWAFTEDYTDSTKVNIGFNVNSNPAATEFAIRDSVAQKWVGSDGVADESARVWRTKAQWNTTASVINRDPTKLNRLGVVARNGDGIETAYIWGTVTTGNVRIVVVNADSMRTHRAISSNYTTAHDQTAANSIFTTAADTIGQVKRGSDYTIWRKSLRYTLPSMDAAIACTIFVTGSKDSSLTDFNVTARPSAWTDAQDISRRFWDYTIGVLPNYITSWVSSSYAATMHWIINAAGISYINSQYIPSGVMRWNFISVRDSSATAPSGAEYIVITSPVIHLRYIKYDTAPTNIVVTAASTTSLIVTWTDNTINEAGFYLVDASTGARIGGDDSTAANVQTKTLSGLSVNTLYDIAVKVKGGKLDGETSAGADSAYTLAAVPGKPTVTFPADSLGIIKLDINGNPSYTEFAIQDSITGLYFDGRYNRFFASTAAESILWRTYAAWGGTSGDTVKVGVGKTYRIRAKARSGL